MRSHGANAPAPHIEMGESEQGLTAGAQAPPSGAEFPAVPAQLGGQEAKGRVGHVDGGRLDKHTKPLAEADFLVANPSPSSRGESHPSALTQPCVTVARYTALVVLFIRPIRHSQSR
ncbi:hypothetical protein GCM10023097_27870 [Streptomyces collinus]